MFPAFLERGGLNKPIRILLVDDEELVRNTLGEFLSHWNYEPALAGTLQECYDFLEREDFSLILCDVRLGSESGLDLITYLRARGMQTPIVMMSGYATIKLAVEATRLGAAYLLEKPINTKELKRSIQKVLAETVPPEEEETEPDNPAESGDADYFYSLDGKVQDIIRMAKVIAPTDAPVLITGASGTGKEVLARIIHQHGDRKDGAFVAVNCGAIPENLVESELFGHVKGAFTGAVRNRKGLFEEANGGTLFLDEIGELPLHMQVKFLRVLQEKRFEPVGSNKSVRSSFRLVSATNKDLEAETEQGGFRSDLLFRINVIHLHNPTLMERPQDVLPLARFFLDRFNKKHQYKITGMVEDVEEFAEGLPLAGKHSRTGKHDGAPGDPHPERADRGADAAAGDSEGTRQTAFRAGRHSGKHVGPGPCGPRRRCGENRPCRKRAQLRSGDHRPRAATDRIQQKRGGEVPFHEPHHPGGKSQPLPGIGTLPSSPQTQAPPRPRKGEHQGVGRLALTGKMLGCIGVIRLGCIQKYQGVESGFGQGKNDRDGREMYNTLSA